MPAFGEIEVGQHVEVPDDAWVRRPHRGLRHDQRRLQERFGPRVVVTLDVRLCFRGQAGGHLEARRRVDREGGAGAGEPRGGDDRPDHGREPRGRAADERLVSVKQHGASRQRS